jgi:hypothetical protein
MSKTNAREAILYTASACSLNRVWTRSRYA